MVPREFAGWLAEAFAAADGIDKADVAGPGFVNVWLAAAAQNTVVESVLAKAVDYGRGKNCPAPRSTSNSSLANPTGPIHLGGTAGRPSATLWAACSPPVARGHPRKLLQRPRRPDRSLCQVAGGIPRWDSPHLRTGTPATIEIAENVVADGAGVLDQNPTSAAKRFRAEGVELMFGQIKRSLHEFTDFDVYYPRESRVRARTRRHLHRTASRPTAALYEGWCLVAAPPPTSATTRTARRHQE